MPEVKANKAEKIRNQLKMRTHFSFSEKKSCPFNYVLAQLSQGGERGGGGLI